MTNNMSYEVWSFYQTRTQRNLSVSLNIGMWRSTVAIVLRVLSKVKDRVELRIIFQNEGDTRYISRDGNVCGAYVVKYSPNSNDYFG